MADLLGNSYITEYVPRVIEEDASGKHSKDLMTKHLENRKLFLVGTVDDDMANDFLVKAIHLIQEKSPIDIYINSLGGSIPAGLMIMDLIEEMKKRGIVVRCICVEFAASMAAVILSAGSPGHRIIFPNAKTMIHEPSLRGGLDGTASTIQETAESILKTRDCLNEILSKNTGKTVKQILKATERRDCWLDSREAVEFGIADKVCGLLNEEVS